MSSLLIKIPFKEKEEGVSKKSLFKDFCVALFSTVIPCIKPELVLYSKYNIYLRLKLVAPLVHEHAAFVYLYQFQHHNQIQSHP